MDGVTILNTVAIAEPHPIFIVGTIIAIVGIITTVFCFEFGYEIVCVGALIFALIGSAVFFGGLIVQVETGKYKYDVILSDTVPMKEFTYYYEIIGQHGEIYTVMERDR